MKRKMNLRELLGNRRGTGYVYVCVLVLAAAMFISLLLLYSSCVGKVRANKTFVSQKLDAYMTRYMTEHAELMVYGTEVYAHIDSEELKKGALEYIGYGENMENLKAEYISGDDFGVKVTYDLYIPVSFLGMEFDVLKVPIRIRSRLVRIMRGT